MVRAPTSITIFAWIMALCLFLHVQGNASFANPKVNNDCAHDFAALEGRTFWQAKSEPEANKILNFDSQEYYRSSITKGDYASPFHYKKSHWESRSREQSMLEKLASKWKRNLTSDEQGAIDEYGLQQSGAINRFLRGKPLDGATFEPERIPALTNHMLAVSKKGVDLPPGILTWRGVRSKKEAQALMNLKTGESYSSAGFWSTSLDPDTAVSFAKPNPYWKNNDRLIVIVEVGPKPLKGILRSGGSEAEIVLPPGMITLQSRHVVRLEDGKDYTILHVLTH
jgi:hypothetical protein